MSSGFNFTNTHRIDSESLLMWTEFISRVKKVSPQNVLKGVVGYKKLVSKLEAKGSAGDMKRPWKDEIVLVLLKS